MSAFLTLDFNHSSKTTIIKRKALDFLEKMSKNKVLIIALFAAMISSIFVTPDYKYFSYIDYKTIVSLFCVLAVVCALGNIKFFNILSQQIVKKFKTERWGITALVFITFIGSMLIANDMALLTFLPLGFIVLKNEKPQIIMFAFILMTIAANLGGMLTPFGNPQNLYLYNHFNIDTLQFFNIMSLPFIVSTLLIFIGCMLFPYKPLKFKSDIVFKMQWKKSIIYFILFGYSLAIIFRGVPYLTGLFVVPILLIMDRKALKDVDYPLLFTFCLFFIFAGNITRIESVKTLFVWLLNKNVYLTGILSCQVISNVPSAILLSSFTNNYKSLLLAVNIGGTGTLIASLASLITYNKFSEKYSGFSLKYLIFYHIIAFSFLIILTIFSFLFVL